MRAIIVYNFSYLSHKLHNMLRLLLLLTLFSVLHPLQAQRFKNSDYKDIFEPSTRPISLSEKGIKTETSISLEPTSKKIDGNRFYYWYKANKIMVTQGGFSGMLLHGDFKAFYRDDQLKESGVFKFGLKHGNWTEWDESGYIIKIVSWNRGIRHGETIEYSGNGEIKKVTVYDRGTVVDLATLSEKEKKKLYKSFTYDIGDNDY